MARKFKSKFKFYRLNQNIRAPQLRVIGQGGKQLGVLSREQALAEAKKAGLDLVEVAPAAQPPVAKLVDYKKFRYQQAKKIKKEKKKSRGGDLKTIRVTPFIAEGDLKVRIKRAKEFIEEGNKVKLEIRFYGRQLTKKEFGYKILKEFISQLEEIAKPEDEPRWIGKRLIMTLSASQKPKTEEKEKKNGQEKKPKEDQAKNKKVSQPKV